MKKIRIDILVAIATIAMISLLVIQFFQLSQLYDRKSNEFKSKVKTLTERIAIRHEKAAELHKYLQVVTKDISPEYKDILKKEFQNLLTAKECIMIHDTTILEQGKPQKYLIIKGEAYDSMTCLRTEHSVLARDVRQLKQLFDNTGNQLGVNQSQGRVSQQLDQRVMQQIFKKSKIINEMLVQAFRDNSYVAPEKRINVEFLDSIICFETRADKLPNDFKFSILNEEGKAIKFSYPTPRYDALIDTASAAKAVLFPSNVLDESLVLCLKFPSKKTYLFKEMGGMLTVSVLLVVIIFLAFTYLFKTILTQNKLSELKNDFISNMTHEFKTPISTISLACQAMQDKDMMGEALDKSTPFVTMIQQENKRLEVLVERILQSATIEKSDVPFKQEDINLTELVSELAAHARFRLKAVHGELDEILPPMPVWITGDKMHTSNMISNLLDNAIKYSNGEPKITLDLRLTEKEIVLKIKDQGIGISKEHIGKIFDKLYRVPTGNVHNVKGFGLGLSYVKAIVDLNRWKISVDSQLGKGSEFSIRIPFIAK